jgi:hypothetical protein
MRDQIGLAAILHQLETRISSSDAGKVKVQCSGESAVQHGQTPKQRRISRVELGLASHGINFFLRTHVCMPVVIGALISGLPYGRMVMKVLHWCIPKV